MIKLKFKISDDLKVYLFTLILLLSLYLPLLSQQLELRNEDIKMKMGTSEKSSIIYVPSDTDANHTSIFNFNNIIGNKQPYEIEQNACPKNYRNSQLTKDIMHAYNSNTRKRVNNPPEINHNIKQIIFNEDGQAEHIYLDGRLYPQTGLFIDPDENDELNFHFWTGTNWSILTEGQIYNSNLITATFDENFILKIKPKLNKNGLEEIKLKAIDLENEYLIHNIQIKINNVNDPPILNNIYKWEKNGNNPDKDSIVFHSDNKTITCTQDYYVDLNVTATDIDSNSLLFSFDGYEIKSSHLSKSLFEKYFKFDANTGNIKFEPTNSWVGYFNITISVSDGEYRDRKNFTFIILNKNDKPVIRYVNDRYISRYYAVINDPKPKQNQQFNFTVFVDDNDIKIGIMDLLHFNATSKDVTIKHENPFGPLAYNFSFVPNNDNAMKKYIFINITVTDQPDKELGDWVIINFSIENTNDPPKIIYVNEEKISENKSKNMGEIKDYESVSFIIEVEDIDQDNLFCFVNNNNTEVEKISSNKWYIVFTPESPNMNWAILNITVYDESIPRGIDWLELNWTYIDSKLTNDPPLLILNTIDPVVKVGEELAIEGKIIDYDDNFNYTYQVIIRIHNATTGLELLSEVHIDVLSKSSFTYSFRVPRTIDDRSTIGTWTIEVIANDGQLNSDLKTSELTIKYAPEDEKQTNNELYILGIILIIIIFTFFFVFIIIKKKKNNKEISIQVEDISISGGKGMKWVPSTEIKCTSCGMIIPALSAKCPRCRNPVEQMYSSRQLINVMEPIAIRGANSIHYNKKSQVQEKKFEKRYNVRPQSSTSSLNNTPKSMQTKTNRPTVSLPQDIRFPLLLKTVSPGKDLDKTERTKNLNQKF